MDNSGMLSIYLEEQPFKIDSLRKYLSDGKEWRIFKGEILSHTNEDFIYYIKKGQFKLCVKQFTGDTVSYCSCTEGTAIQINQLLMNESVWIPPFALATENSIVVSFSRQQFYKMTQSDQELFDEYINVVSSFSTILKQRLLIVSLLSANQRLLCGIDTAMLYALNY